MPLPAGVKSRRRGGLDITIMSGQHVSSAPHSNVGVKTVIPFLVEETSRVDVILRNNRDVQGMLTLEGVMSMVHEQHRVNLNKTLDTKMKHMNAAVERDATYFNLSRVLIDEIVSEAVESELEVWSTAEVKGKSRSIKGETLDKEEKNKSGGMKQSAAKLGTEFSIGVGGDVLALVGHSCEKFLEDLAHRSLAVARRRRSRVIDVQDIQEVVRSSEVAIMDYRPESDRKKTKLC